MGIVLFFEQIIKLLLRMFMLSRIFSAALMSITSKRNYKTLTKCPPASLLHRVKRILNSFSGKRRDSLTMAALSFTKSTGLCTIFAH